jgi:GT2 family glycosyltransferase
MSVSTRDPRYHGDDDGRGQRRDDATLSFIIAWSPEVPLTSILVRDLHAACARHGRELVIVTNRSGNVGGTACVQIVNAAADADRGAMLAHGARVASGDILHFLKETSLAGPSFEMLCTKSARRDLPLRLKSAATAPMRLSVIIPAHRNAQMLSIVLAAVRVSDLANDRLELIVVNDAGGPQVTDVAARFADAVVRLDANIAFGPAYARNRGVELATSPYLVFLDSDVRVHRDTLRRFADAFSKHPEVSAFVGSYDADPPVRGLVSQYRNLMRHFIHQCYAGDVATFWAGCAAIHVDAFRQAGTFDEWRFPRRQLEDGELGQRLRALGHRIVLYPDIQATHLKRWTLGSLIRTELNDRGVPWMRLAKTSREAGLLADAPRPLGSLRAALAWSALLLGADGCIFRIPSLVFAAGILLIPSLLANVPLYVFLFQRRGLLFTLATAPLDLLCDLVIGVAAIMGLTLREAVGDPQPDPTTDAFAEVGLKTWPPVRARPFALEPTTSRAPEQRSHSRTAIPVAPGA